MPKHRVPLPTELQEIVNLIKQGRLFEVKARLDLVRPELSEEFVERALFTAIKTGFHSMVQILLSVASPQCLNRVLEDATGRNRLDLVELICQHGGDPKLIPYDVAVATHDPRLLRFFEQRGVDLESGSALAIALQNKNRAALGTFMRFRQTDPALLRQVNMALRHHAGEGNLKWVSLLLWAGGDPRAVVPHMDERYEDVFGTALEEAIEQGHVEILKKFKLDPVGDDVTKLLRRGYLTPNLEVAELLMSLGAHPGNGEEGSALRSYVHTLAWTLEGLIYRRDSRHVVDVLCLFAAKGAQWSVLDRNSFGGLRRGLAKASGYEAISVLCRLEAAGLFTAEVFRKLMSTPKMEELLNLPYSGVARLRSFAEKNPNSELRCRRRQTSTSKRKSTP